MTDSSCNPQNAKCNKEYIHFLAPMRREWNISFSMHKQLTHFIAFKKNLSVNNIPSKSKLMYFSTMLEKIIVHGGWTTVNMLLRGICVYGF